MMHFETNVVFEIHKNRYHKDLMGNISASNLLWPSLFLKLIILRRISMLTIYPGTYMLENAIKHTPSSMNLNWDFNSETLIQPLYIKSPESVFDSSYFKPGRNLEAKA